MEEHTCCLPRQHKTDEYPVLDSAGGVGLHDRRTNKQPDRLPSSVSTMILVRQQPVKCCPATDKLFIVTTKTHDADLLHLVAMEV